MQVFIQQQLDAERQFQWYMGSDDAVHFETFSGGVEELSSFAEQYSHISQWVFLIPAIECIYKRLNFAEKERKHIAKALPFLLEESILSDVDDLHIVSEKPQKSYVDVVALEKSKLNTAMQVLEDAGIEAELCLPEQSVFLYLIQQVSSLDENANDHCLYVMQLPQYYLLAYAGQLYALEPEHFNVALDNLFSVDNNQPQSVHIWFTANNDETSETVAEHMQQTLEPLLDDVQSFSINAIAYNYAQEVQARIQQPQQAQRFNFLSGSFGRTIDWLAAVKPWWFVLVLLAVVYVAQMLLLVGEISQAKDTLFMQQAELEKLSRQVIPKGNIVDPQKQIQRELDKLNAGGAGEQFLPKFYAVGQILSDVGVAEFNSVQYESNTQMLRLDFLIENYDKLQAMINQMKAKGIEAEIQNSNAQDDKLRARLNIKA